MPAWKAANVNAQVGTSLSTDQFYSAQQLDGNEDRDPDDTQSLFDDSESVEAAEVAHPTPVQPPAPLQPPAPALQPPGPALQPPAHGAPVAVAPHVNLNIVITDPSSYIIVHPVQPNGLLLLTAQHAHIHDMLRRTFTLLEHDLLFRHAFPDMVDRSRGVQVAMFDASVALKYHALAQRLEQDPPFGRALIPLVCTSI